MEYVSIVVNAKASKETLQSLEVDIHYSGQNVPKYFWLDRLIATKQNQEYCHFESATLSISAFPSSHV